MTPSTYPIIQVLPEMVENKEDMGSKAKFWFRHEGQRWLFKHSRPNTGEHWAEKVGAEIALALDLNAARVELAEYNSEQGCASLSLTLRQIFFLQSNRN